MSVKTRIKRNLKKFLPKAIAKRFGMSRKRRGRR
jgi:hypothetical protein